MSAPLVLLIGSVFLGPSVWRPVQRVLQSRGWDCDIAAPGTRVRSADAVSVLAALQDEVPSGRELLLVPHSNAGLYVPQLVAGGNVAASIFVDAVLPAASGPTPVAPAPVLRQLASRTGPDGLLPPWSDWWDPADMAALVPDNGLRAEVVAEQPRLPLAYLHDSVAVPPGWAEQPGGYLAFGETYAAEAAEAGRRGWPVARLDGRHLHMLADPPAVADGITGLAATLGVAPRR